MAENPATWGDAERIADAAYANWHDWNMQGIYGYSLPRFICLALREAGLLREAAKQAEDVPQAPGLTSEDIPQSLRRPR